METLDSRSGRSTLPAPRGIVADPRWRLQRVWLEDRLEELSGGVLALVGAAFWLLVRQQPLWFVAFLPAFVAGGWLYRRVFFALKTRLMDRRTGYVRPRTNEWFRQRSLRFWICYFVAFGAVYTILDRLPPRPLGLSIAMIILLGFVVVQPAFYA